MQEKASTLTIRLTAEEAQQVEVIKKMTGKTYASDAIKYMMREYPRFCEHYKQRAAEWRQKEAEYQVMRDLMTKFGETLGEVTRLSEELTKGK